MLQQPRSQRDFDTRNNAAETDAFDKHAAPVSQAGASQPSADSEAVAEPERIGIQHVARLASLQSVGQVHERVYPYTRQVKADARYQFDNEKDTKFFDSVDSKLWWFRFRFLFLAGMSLTSYVALLSLSAAELPLPFIPLAFLLVALMLGLFFSWYDAENTVKNFGKSVDKHYSDILHEMSDCERRIGKGQDLAREAEMSENWTKIYLWNLMRLSVVDRYATAAYWKMAVSTQNTRIFVFVLLVLAFVARASAKRDDTSLMIVEAALIVPGMMVLFCRNFFAWQSKYQEETKDLARNAPFDVLGGSIRNLVARARANEHRH